MAIHLTQRCPRRAVQPPRPAGGVRQPSDSGCVCRITPRDADSGLTWRGRTVMASTAEEANFVGRVPGWCGEWEHLAAWSTAQPPLLVGVTD